MTYYPPLFLSHGAPNMALHDTPVRSFMSQLGSQFQKPKAIVICSAHFETKGTVVVTDPNPEMIYDFRGFESELYNFKYSADGEPNLAHKVLGLLEASNIDAVAKPERGFDHGVWVPLALAWPEADIPIVQISIDPDETPEYHYKLGRALSSLAHENIALIGSGNITHNLHAVFTRGTNADTDQKMKVYADEFLSWFNSQIDSGNSDMFLNYRENAPFSEENHPTDEHLLPIFFTLGVAGENYRAEKLHQSFTFDFLAMDAWGFHPQTSA